MYITNLFTALKFIKAKWKSLWKWKTRDAAVFPSTLGQKWRKTEIAGNFKKNVNFLKGEQTGS